MVIIYDSVLTEPPSSIHCFRDVTLYVKVFFKEDNVLRCPKGTKTSYWKWIKRYGAHDFIDQLITCEEYQEGVLIGKEGQIVCDALSESNYQGIINLIESKLLL